MRRFLLLALFVPALLAAALNAEEPTWSWGFKGGVIASNASLSPDLSAGEKKSSRTGFAGGGFAEARLSETLSAQLEALYAMKGFDVTSNGQTLEFRADYLELPLTLKATFGAGVFRPYVFAGPDFGIRLYTMNTFSLRDRLKSTDFAIDMGGGFLYRLNAATSLVLDARYSLGLVNVLNGSMGSDSAKSRNVKVLAGVRFAER